MDRPISLVLEIGDWLVGMKIGEMGCTQCDVLLSIPLPLNGQFF